MTSVLYLHQMPRIRGDLDYLLRNDPVFRKQDIDPGQFTWPYMGPDFAGLVRIVIGQQVSTKAADSLWARFSAAVPDVTPEKIARLSPDEMRALGLSRQKSSYIHGLCEAVRSGVFDLPALEKKDDAAVYEAITALRGLGNWSAEMYLMFGLARPDIWPAGDLGIREGLRVYLSASQRPTIEETQREGARFTGRRTAAALLLWRLKTK